MNLKNKRILVTAGSTWVPIDSVRVISNTATGETGILLAEKLVSLGAKVTLLLGPVVLATCRLNNKIILIRFRYFDELNTLLKKELNFREYDIAIHTAAVSDYKPKYIQKGKISSSLKELNIKFIPTTKIIDIFKKMQPSIFLVGFKFKPEASRLRLIKDSQRLMYNSQADFVVANTLKTGHYIAYLVTKNGESAPILTKKNTVANLIKAMLKR